MGILDRFRGRDDQPAPVSPQGWTDDVEGWPALSGDDPRAPLREDLRSPSAAAERVVEALEGLVLEREASFSREQASLRMATLGRCLQALRLPPEEMTRRKGTFGKLVRALVGYLTQLPWLLQKTAIRTSLETLLADLKGSGDEGLGRAAGHLERALGEAQELLAFLLEPKLDLAASAPAPAASEPADTPPAPPPSSPREAPPAKPGKVVLASQSSPDLTADLTQEKIYRCFLEECMKDGKLSAGEEESMLALRRLLGIPIHRHAAIVREVGHAVENGRLEGDTEAELPEFYEKIYRIAMEDGVLTPDEQKLLHSVAGLLGITKAEVAATETRVGTPG